MAASGWSRMGKGLRWQIAPPWEKAGELARRVRVSPLIAQVLHNRGLDDVDAIGRFLSPKLTDLHDPGLLHGIEPAAGCLAAAVRDGRKICIYGDYDVDGMAGVAILYRCLTMHGGQVDYYVPHRLEEGYGVNVEAIEKIAASGAKLLVTVDCGISARAPLRRARELGMEVIVTDHHAPGRELPDVLAVVHPAMGERAYPNPDLSGSGVAFKLAWQVLRCLCGASKVDEPMRQFLLEATSLAALGTIADVVPLLGENRVLAAFGLRGLAQTQHVGIRALIESAGLDGQKLDAYHVGFCLAPRLNACGRMGHARLAVELLARADADRCRRIAQHLETQNDRRQRVEREILDQAVAMVEAGAAGAGQCALVLASKDWHAGVVGIVAARLVERFGRPAVVIAVSGDEGQGSARSIPGFHLRDALAACAEHLKHFGGHAMAAGLRLPTDRIDAFAAAFAEHARRTIPAQLLQPALRIDRQASLGELSLPVVEHLERLAPFGHGNPRARVALRACRLLSAPTRMGRSGSTVSFVVTQAASVQAAAAAGAAGRLRCVGFGMGELADRLAGVRAVDIAGQPVVNRYNGRSSVELHVDDVVCGDA